MIIIFLVYYFLLKKLYHSDNIIYGNTHLNVDKLMIVAHPDDETIFGGKELLSEEGWLVVCITGGSDKSVYKLKFEPAKTRIKEFSKVMNKMNCGYQIWDYEDNNFNANWDEFSLLEKLNKIIYQKNWKKIITHNLNGEYGHVQHKKLSQIIHQIKPNNFYVFNYIKSIDEITRESNENPHFDKILSVLKNYSSQENIIKKYIINIKYQSIIKVNF